MLEEAADLWKASSEIPRIWKEDPQAVEHVTKQQLDKLEVSAASAQLSLYRLSIQRTAWGIVCERLGISVNYLQDTFGRCFAEDSAIARCEENVMPTPDEIRETMTRFGGSEPADVPTAEDIAGNWLALFSAFEAG